MIEKQEAKTPVFERGGPKRAELTPHNAGMNQTTPAPRVKGQPADPQKFAVNVKPSQIDGQGAFAGEAIPARRKIGEIRGESISVREAARRASRGS